VCVLSALACGDSTVTGGPDASSDTTAAPDVTTSDVTQDITTADVSKDVSADVVVSCPALDGGASTLCTPDAGSPYCANTTSDTNNCGGCGVVCASTQVCTNGACALPKPKLVFVSSMQYGANLGGLGGADAKCQALATASSLSGTYKAWLSDDTTSAATRLAHAKVAYVLPDGSTVVANDWAGLTSGTLAHAIDRTEDGGTPATTSYCSLTTPTVFSNTLPSGTQDAVGFNCTNWTGAGTKVNLGNANATDLHWSTWCSANATAYCDGTNVAALYCIEQ